MKRRIKGSLGTLYVLALLAIVTACGGGGGGGGGNSGSPRLFVSPQSHDFGTVTTGNTVQPLSLTIRNDGSGNLGVSSMGLSDGTHFVLNPGTCGPTPTLGPGASCTATVDFKPAAEGSWGANLDIVSNAGTVSVPLQGVSQPITGMTVSVNQTDACARPGTATAYVSVQDQGGFPVNGLLPANFVINEFTEALEGPDKTPSSAPQTAGETSAAIVMDFSTSITDEPSDVQRMEEAAVAFVQQLGADDEVEIIKFAGVGQIEVIPFTNDIPTLVESIRRPVPSDWVGTALYDAVIQAVRDTDARPAGRRKAVIVVSDGNDTRGGSRAAAIAEANDAGIPVFTIGLGDEVDVNTTDLQAVADQTGGTYTDSRTTANLATIFQQLADLLFLRQYVLTYTADAGTTAIQVTATHPTLPISGVSPAVPYPLCP